MLLYRSAPLAVLIGHPHPPADFRAYPVRDFPRAGVFVSTSPLEGINSAYYADYELGGEKVFACLYDAGAGQTGLRNRRQGRSAGQGKSASLSWLISATARMSGNGS